MRREHLGASAQMEKLRLGKVRVILSLPRPREPLVPARASGQVQRGDLCPVRGPLAPGCPGGVGRASRGLFSPSSAQFLGTAFPRGPAGSTFGEDQSRFRTASAIFKLKDDHRFAITSLSSG